MQQVPAKGVPADAVRAQTAVGRRGAVFRPIGDRLRLVPAPAPRLHRSGCGCRRGSHAAALGRSAGVNALAARCHHALAVGAGLERAVFQQAGAARLSARLTDNVAQLMAEQRLSMHGHQIELAGRKGDMAALGERVRARVGHGLALVQLDAGQVRTKGLLHFGLDRGGQIHPARALLNRGQAGH